MNKFLGAAVALALVGVAAPAFADSSTATAQASASANVLKAITVTKSQDLNFGTLVAPNAGSGPGAAVMSTNNSNTITPSGGVVLLGLATARKEAVFKINAELGAAYTVSVNGGSNTVTLSQTGGSGDANITLTLATSTLPTSGSSADQLVNVGGSLAVPSSAGGNYSGTFTLAATYN
jgi:hypothetical protein